MRQLSAEMRARLVMMRMDKGLTQAQVAERIGVTQATVSRLETGLRAPDPNILRCYVAAVEGALTCLACGQAFPCAYDDDGRPMIHATELT